MFLSEDSAVLKTREPYLQY